MDAGIPGLVTDLVTGWRGARVAGSFGMRQETWRSMLRRTFQFRGGGCLANSGRIKSRT